MASELGRLGAVQQGRRRRRGGPTRRGLVVLVLLGVGASLAVVRPLPDGLVPAPEAQATPAPAAADDPEVVSAAEAGQLLLGLAGSLELHVPAEEAVLVSFHEASLPAAMAIAPVGSLGTNANATRFTDPGGRAGGAPYNVQVSRGRSNAPTSAVDVVLEDDEPVLTPVAGVVVSVREYQLYNTYDDVRVEIRPDGAPELAVVLIHVRDVQVRPGQRLTLGDVLAGGARRFPFDAVVDREVAPRKLGHVHIEVKRADEEP